MIGYSHHIWEPYRLPFFITLSFFLLFLSQIKKSKWVLYLSALFFFVSLMYISTFLTLIPIFFFFLYHRNKILNLNSKLLWLLLALSLGFLLSGLYGKEIFVHRLSSLYPLFFLIVSYFLSLLNRLSFQKSV